MTLEIYDPQGKLVWDNVLAGRDYDWKVCPSVRKTVKDSLSDFIVTSTREGFLLEMLYGDIKIEPGTPYDVRASMILEKVGVKISDDGGALMFRDGSKIVATSIGYRNF